MAANHCSPERRHEIAVKASQAAIEKNDWRSYDRTGQKRCPKCGLEKGLASFYVRFDETRRVQPDPWCKACMNAKSRAYNKRQPKRASLPPEQLEKERIRERRYQYKKNYGLTLDEVEAMMAARDGRCDICGQRPKERNRRLEVDHCHETGQVRGLLCTQCNTGLGRFKDDVALIRKAAEYLEKAEAAKA